MSGQQTPLQAFTCALQRSDVIAHLRDGLIGETALVEGPFGPRPMVYADYVASGRALRQVESFVLDQVLPYYANSHTEASYCGQYITRMRREARSIVAAELGATDAHAVIFAGSGATAGLNKLVTLLGIDRAVRAGQRVAVFIGPYEHHSNILPWRESGAEIFAIPEAPDGGPDCAELEDALRRTQGYALRVGTFSAASNVTGVLSEVVAVTRLLKRHDALAIWDYAAGAPYLDIAMTPAPDASIDAIVLSPHKFPGGPGASGLLVVRRDAVATDRPTAPGGGTVSFVSATGHDYAADVVAREEAGTPNVIGDIRAALALMVKRAVGPAAIAARHATLDARALAAWQANPRLELMGIVPGRARLPIFSFRIRDGAGGHVHHQLFTRMLSDCHGIQARGGCSCAGPYGLSLLGFDDAGTEALRLSLKAGREIEKPGWVRLNFSYLMSDAKAAFVVASVDRLARDPHPMADTYECDLTTARFAPRAVA